MVIRVTEDNLEAFSPLIPLDMRAHISAEDWFCLGILASRESEADTPHDIPHNDSASEEPVYTAAGVLVFSAEDGIDSEGDTTAVILLHWLYISEKYRRQGLANLLMQNLSEILEDNPAEGIICDLPFDSRYDLIRDFLTSWGFDFDVIDSPEMIVTKAHIREFISSEGVRDVTPVQEIKLPRGAVLINNIHERVFAEAVSKFKQAEKSGFYDLISEDRADYVTDLSLVFLHGMEINSMVLFEKEGRDRIHCVLTGSLPGDDMRELKALLNYSLAYFYLHYPERAKLRITMEPEITRRVFGGFFPDMVPVKIFRGYLIFNGDII